MDVPSPSAGVVEEILVDDRRQGLRGRRADPELEGGERRRSRGRRRPRRSPRRAGGAVRAATPTSTSSSSAPGPAATRAAFRAADLGLKTVAGRALRAPRRRLPQRRLHPVQGAAARRARDRRGRGGGGARHRLRRAADRPRRAARLEGARSSSKLTGGLDGLAKQRKVDASCTATARSPAPNTLEVRRRRRTIAFEHCIIAAGSQPRAAAGSCPTTRA